MKLLFDQNLSHRLSRHLADLFPGSAHVRALNLERSADEQIWAYAAANGFCIVTQDSDFAEKSRLFGAPPKVIWLRCGNATPAEVELLLRKHAQLIEHLQAEATLHFLEIS